ncbi:hypothetical protein FRC01_011757, partial [Tulasnella sp. 417]
DAEETLDEVRRQNTQLQDKIKEYKRRIEESAKTKYHQELECGLLTHKKDHLLEYLGSCRPPGA